MIELLLLQPPQCLTLQHISDCICFFLQQQGPGMSERIYYGPVLYCKNTTKSMLKTKFSYFIRLFSQFKIQFIAFLLFLLFFGW